MKIKYGYLFYHRNCLIKKQSRLISAVSFKPGVQIMESNLEIPDRSVFIVVKRAYN